MKNKVVSLTAILAAIIVHAHAFTNKNCDHKCVLAGNTYCGPIPCPYVPCDVQRVTTPGDCCEHCPTDKNETKTNRAAAIFCPHPCTQGGQHYCHPIPCPLPPCDNPITTPGECCPHCPDDAQLGRRVEPVQDCPQPCSQGGHHYCHPVPCPHPPCPNPVTTPGECCPHCPDDTQLGRREEPVQDCPQPCTQGGHHYCHPVPCPHPPCPNPVTTPGECCPHCPDDAQLGRRVEPVQNCPQPCTQGGHHYCHPVPCPPTPCPNPVTTPGECCPHCHDDSELEKRADCPFNCTINGHHFCHHIPCPLPPCANPVTTTGDCCPHCPDGPTCTYQGVTIPVGQSAKIGSLTCYCKAGGVQGLVDCA